MHFAVAAEYKRAPFCPRGVLRRPPFHLYFSLSFSLSLLTTTCIRCTHSLEAYAHTHTSARLSPSSLSSPFPHHSSLSLFFPLISFFAPSVCFYVWTSKVRRKGCCALRVRNSRDIDKNKIHPHPHPRRASPIVGN